MWLPETSFDIQRPQAWKPVSIKDTTGQKPSPSTMSITQMPAVEAVALGEASSCRSFIHRKSDVLISDFLKLLPEKHTRLQCPGEALAECGWNAEVAVACTGQCPQAASAPRPPKWIHRLIQRGLFVINGSFLPSQQGASCCQLSQHGGHNCGFRTRESRWASSQHLEHGCQFGFVLPFDLFFSPDAHSVQCVQQHGVWERALDQEGQAETPSLFLLVLHKDWSCTLLTLLSFSHYSRRSHSLVGGRPRNNHHIMFQV